MATVNLSRKARRNQKRGICVFTTILNIDEVATSADVYQLMRLPAGSLVTFASAVVMTANDAATSAAADLGFESGTGNELIAAANLKAVAGTELTNNIDAIVKETGDTIVYTPTYVGTPTAGKVLIRIEYIEYEKITGELTNFVPEA